MVGGNNGSEVKARSLKNVEFRPFINSRGTDVEARGLNLFTPRKIFFSYELRATTYDSYFTFHTKKLDDQFYFLLSTQQPNLYSLFKNKNTNVKEIKYFGVAI